MSAQRIEYFAVVRPPNDFNPNPAPDIALTREHAEALVIVKQHEWPNLGPFRVVRLVEAGA